MKSLEEIEWSSIVRGPFNPSPDAWEDQCLYSTHALQIRKRFG